jgi:hypothetical protein
VILVHRLATRHSAVGKVILTMEPQEDFLGAGAAHERPRDRGRDPRHEGGLQQHVLCLRISVLEDFRREVVKEQIGRPQAWHRLQVPLARELLERQYEPGAPPVCEGMKAVYRVARPSAGRDDPG